MVTRLTNSMRCTIHREYVAVLHFNNIPQSNAQTNIVDYLLSLLYTQLLTTVCWNNSLKTIHHKNENILHIYVLRYHNTYNTAILQLLDKYLCKVWRSKLKTALLHHAQHSSYSATLWEYRYSISTIASYAISNAEWLIGFVLPDV